MKRSDEGDSRRAKNLVGESNELWVVFFMIFFVF